MTSTLKIKKQGITKLSVDCIVNAANSQLQHGGGVCGAIFAEAGAKELQAACNGYGFCPTGEAVLTPGFKLKAKYIAQSMGCIKVGLNPATTNTSISKDHTQVCVCVRVCVCVCVSPLAVLESVSESSCISASVSPDSQPPARSSCPRLSQAL